MILPDHAIHAWAGSGGVTPFNPDNVNPASIDLTASNLWVDPQRPDVMVTAQQFVLYPMTLDVVIYNTVVDALYNLGIKLKRKTTFVLMSTTETIHLPADMACELKLKTTPSREGLGFPLADWIDPGYAGRLTLMLTANRKITLHCGQRVCQMVMYRLDSAVNHPYGERGHYMNQKQPTLSWRTV